MAYHLRAFVGGQQHLLPDFDDLAFSSIHSDAGSISFGYAVTGINASLVVNEAEVALFDEAGEVPDSRAVIEQRNTETYQLGGRTFVKVTCRTLWKILGEGLVYPDTYPGTPGKRVHAGVTVGAVLDGTLRKSQQMGELAGLTWTFTATKDSYGNDWPGTVSLEVDLGVPILQFLQNLVDQGMVEVRMQGRVVVAVAPGKLGVDRTTGANPLTLWAAQSAIEAPEQTVSSGIRTVAIVKGEGDVYVEVEDATAKAKYGRRPVMVNASGVSDAGTMRVIGQNTLAQTNDVRSSNTYQYPVRPGLPVPMRDLLPGDWTLTDATSSATPLERVRVLQVSITAAADDVDGVCTLTLNDIFMDRDIQLARKVAGISGGATGNGGTPGGPSGEDDGVAPGQIFGFGLSSQAYNNMEGINSAQITASWLPVTENADGTALEDLSHYEVRWRYSRDAALTWGPSLSTPDTKVSWSPVEVNAQIAAQARAVDRAGNPGAWTNIFTITAANDQTPPPVPSTPVLAPTLNGLQVRWDGLGSAGEAMPADLDRVEIHASVEAAFTPSTTTLLGQLETKGVYPIHDLPYDTDTYVRLVAVDAAIPPNRSAASAAAKARAERLVAADIADSAVTAEKVAANAITVGKLANGAVTATKIGDDAIETRHLVAGAVTTLEIAAGSITASSGILGDLAVTTAKIADLAVNGAKIANATIQDAKIATIAAGKITSGSVTADLIVSGNIQTAASGQRVVLNAAGIHQYNGSGQRQTYIPSDGSTAQLVGNIRARTFVSAGADTNGTKFVEIGDISGTEANDEIRFRNGNISSLRNPVSNPGRLRVSTQNSGTTATMDFDSIGGVMANRFTVDDTDTGGPYISGDSGYVTIRGGPSRGSQSARLFLGSVDGHAWVSSQGAALKLLNGSNTVQVRNSDDGSYGILRAASVEQVSGSHYKEQVTDLKVNALAAIGSARLKVWRWKNDDGSLSDDDGIGLLVDELPHWITRGQNETYDIAAMLGLLWEACHELHQKVEALT